MRTRSVTKEAADHVVDWLKKEPWDQRWPEFQHNMLTTIASRQGIDLEDIRQKFSSDQAAGTLFGALFEHFVEIDFEEPPRNVVDSYLQRRGWKESRQGKIYLQRLRETPFSLYEVVDVEPGKSVTVRDLIRPLPPVEVIEISGSKQITTLHHLMLKVVELDGQWYFSGSLLQIPSQALEPLVQRLKEAMQASGLSLSVEKYSEEVGTIKAILHAYALDMMAEAIGYLVSGPQVFNVEGDRILITEIRFPVKDAERVTRILNAHPEFERADTEEDEKPFWNWLFLKNPAEETPVTLPEGAVILKTDLLSPKGGTFLVRGNVELASPNKLLCSLMSKERGEALLALLTPLLGDAVGMPVTTYQSLEQMESRPGGGKATSLDLSPEEVAEITAEFLEAHYRGLLDTVIPTLHGKTPREAARTKEGQADVAKWIRYLEASQDRAVENGMPRYDCAWMWRELDVEHLKPSKVR